MDFCNIARVLFANRLWVLGWGEELGYSTFEEYLKEIPIPPLQPEECDERFNFLLLVDERITFQAACRRLRISVGGFDPRDVDAYFSTTGKGTVRWIWAQPGRQNHTWRPGDVRPNYFSADEIVLTIFEAVAFFAHYRDAAPMVNGMTILGRRIREAQMVGFLFSVSSGTGMLSLGMRIPGMVLDGIPSRWIRKDEITNSRKQ